MSRKGENIYKRKDGRWEGRYKSAENRYHSVYGKSYQEVKGKLISLKATPQPTKSSDKLTVGVLFEEWLSAVKLKIKESTFANYRMKADKHILPEFSEKRYSDLSADLIHNFIEIKLKSGLSAKYVSDIVVVFKSMAKYISRVHGYSNPVSEVVLPKVQRKEMKIFTDEQRNTLCGKLLKNLDNTSICILLSLYTGLRVGEVCGLKWGDIDFEKSILTVSRTVQRLNLSGRGTKLIIGTPKSQSSVRSIPIPDFLVKILHKMRRKSNCYILSGNENVIEPRTLQNRFKSILKSTELPQINYHSLRHSFATNCIQLGFDVKTLSEILGHSNVETTLNLYVHSSIERKAMFMNLLKIPA